jgi:hypothetical protein
MKTKARFAMLLILPCHPISSKLSRQSNFWFKCKFFLIDISSNMRQETIFTRQFLQRKFECAKHMGIDACLKVNSIEGGLASSSTWEGE